MSTFGFNFDVDVSHGFRFNEKRALIRSDVTIGYQDEKTQEEKYEFLC
jgi:hypothetical protein